MKKVLILILAIALVSLIATSCSGFNGDFIKDVNMSEIDNDEVRAILEEWQAKNGAYLLHDNSKSAAVYLFLNSSNAVQGQKPTCIEGLKIEYLDDVMRIYYNEKEAEDLGNIRNQVIYKMQSDNAPKIIEIYKNDEKTYFEAISTVED